jgi:hypothetical protein
MSPSTRSRGDIAMAIAATMKEQAGHFRSGNWRIWRKTFLCVNGAASRAVVMTLMKRCRIRPG